MNNYTHEISQNKIREHIDSLIDGFEPLSHRKILNGILDLTTEIDFRKLANLNTDKEAIKKKHHLVLCVEKVLLLAEENNWGICKNHGVIYLYNGAFWQLLEDEDLKIFLADAAKRMGICRFDADYFRFKEDLYNQFLAMAYLRKPERSSNEVLINLKNGTFVVTETGCFLRGFDRLDFLTYQLPFNYDASAKSIQFNRYLDEVLPDKESQTVTAEFLGYVFMPQEILKLEKALLLYGTGANGKSVFFDIMTALLGKDNICHYSLKSLTKDNGNHRAKMENKLVNFTSELGGTIETSFFKQLVSGEPIEARLLYKNPFIMRQYGKLIFNCNELPKDVEQSDAYYRRLLIIPFHVKIPEADQDKELAKKIIQSALPGVFNWVLDGLQRVLMQRKFSKCEAASKMVNTYRKESDSVQMFLDEDGLDKSTEKLQYLKDLYLSYSKFIKESGYRACSKNTFSQRLKGLGFEFTRKANGIMVYIKKSVE